MDDSFTKSKVPVFKCIIKQAGNLIKLNVPYGSLENFIRLHLQGSDTFIEIDSIGFVDL